MGGSVGAGGMGSVGGMGGVGGMGVGGGGCTTIDVIADGDLEAGPMGGSWIESSSNFTTPICDTVGCGTGGGTGPNAGSYWAWFGGADFFALFLPEIGTLSQTMVIPPGTATLEFMFEIPVCDSFLDTFTVSIDGQMLFFRDGSDVDCGLIGYTKQSIDVSAFGDGNNHTLEFEGVNEAAFFGPTNFMVDDITLLACQ